MKLFDKLRKRDINLEIAVSDIREELTSFAFKEPALNGFLKNISEARTSKAEILFTKKIATVPLKEILNEHLQANTIIDFMSIDAEGLDLNIVFSNNWEKYRPTYVLVECLENQYENIFNLPMYKFLNGKHYSFFVKTVNTYFYISSN